MPFSDVSVTRFCRNLHTLRPPL